MTGPEKKFYEGHAHRIMRALEAIAEELKRANDMMEKRGQDVSKEKVYGPTGKDLG